MGKMKLSKKINIIVAFLVIIFAVMVVFGLDTRKARINKMNPASNAMNLGEIINVMQIALSGDGVCLFDSMPDFSYGTGSSDTTKLRIIGDTRCYFNGTRLIAFDADTVKAFTATTHDVPDGEFGSFRVSVASNRAVTLTMSAATYETLDSARTNVAATPAGSVNLGYIVIEADGALFNATTTKLNASTVVMHEFPEGGYIYDFTQ